jgi:hypothetical protein
MRRILLSMAVTVAALVSPAAASPSSASSEEVCTGQGTMVTGARLTYALVGPSVATTWSFSPAIGLCVPGPDLIRGTGFITGWCDFATGRGITPTGHEFSFLVVGLRFVMTGEVTGEASFFPDVLAAHSCVWPGASHFLLWLKGAVARDCEVVDTGGTTPVLPLHHSECL